MSDEAPLPVVRRRFWPRIVALLLLLVAVGGGIAWLAWPKTVTSTALFEVRREEPSLVGSPTSYGNSETNYEILKKTQLALLKSKFLLTSALRHPSIGGLPIFAGLQDPEEWLSNHLKVEFPENGEILSIALRGPAAQANDLSLIVDAVANAYKTEVLGNETSRRMNQHDMLERSLQNLQTELKRKSEDWLDIAKGMGKAEGSNDFQMQLNMKRMDRIDDELAQLEREQLRIETGGDGKDSKFVVARIGQLVKSRDELLKTMQKRSERSVDLATRENELAQLQKIADEMSASLEKMEVDRQLPSRIRQIQPATLDQKQVARQ